MSAAEVAATLERVAAERRRAEAALTAGLPGACWCPSCAPTGQLAVAVGTCRFHVEGPRPVERTMLRRDDAIYGWLWSCGCGSASSWWASSSALAYHAWRRHAGLETWEPAWLCD